MKLEPKDMEDLSAASPWIDVKTVAMRAVRIHGGFKAYNAV